MPNHRIKSVKEGEWKSKDELMSFEQQTVTLSDRRFCSCKFPDLLCNVYPEVLFSHTKLQQCKILLWLFPPKMHTYIITAFFSGTGRVNWVSTEGEDSKWKLICSGIHLYIPRDWDHPLLTHIMTKYSSSKQRKSISKTISKTWLERMKWKNR